MILLTAVTETLELVTANAGSVDYTAAWADLTTTTFTPGTQQANVASAATTTIAPAPAAATQRQIKLLTVRNRHASSSQTVMVQKHAGGTQIVLTPNVVLAPGEVLEYLDGQGFSVLDPFAARKVVSSLAAGQTVMVTNKNGQVTDPDPTESLNEILRVLVEIKDLIILVKGVI